MEQTPSIGRVVHYVSYGTPKGEYKSECRAAIITAVKYDHDKLEVATVSLCVLNPSGFFFNETVLYSENHKGGSWHWPERT